MINFSFDPWQANHRRRRRRCIPSKKPNRILVFECMYTMSNMDITPKVTSSWQKSGIQIASEIKLRKKDRSGLEVRSKTLKTLRSKTERLACIDDRSEHIVSSRSVWFLDSSLTAKLSRFVAIYREKNLIEVWARNKSPFRYDIRLIFSSTGCLIKNIC